MRRKNATLLCAHEILAKDYSAFEFFGTRVFDIAKVNEATFVPIIAPSACRSHGEVGKRTVAEIETHRSVAIETYVEVEGSLLGRDYDGVGPLFADACAIAKFHINIICAIIQFALNYSVGTFFFESCGVAAVLIPVASVVAMLSCRIRESQHHLDGAIRLDMRSHNILVGVANGFDMVVLFAIFESALHLSCPKVESFVDIAHEVRVGKVETNIAEMKAMRILAEVVGSILLTTRGAELCSIIFIMTTMEVVVDECFFYLVAFVVRERMPSPVRHGAKRHSVAIFLRKGLQTCSINGKGEASVAHGERS